MFAGITKTKMATPIEVKVDSEKGFTTIVNGYRIRLSVDETNATITVRDEDNQLKMLYLEKPVMNAIKQLLNLTDL